MKTIKIILLAVAFTFSGVLTASTDPEPTKEALTETISIEIGKLLKNPKFLIEEDMLAKVKVVINEDNELVVLSVQSDDEDLENYIKGRLNYKELSVKLRTGQKAFLVPVRITQKG